MGRKRQPLLQVQKSEASDWRDRQGRPRMPDISIEETDSRLSDLISQFGGACLAEDSNTHLDQDILIDEPSVRVEDIDGEMPWSTEPGPSFREVFDKAAPGTLDGWWRQLATSARFSGSQADLMSHECLGMLRVVFSEPLWLLQCRSCEVYVYGSVVNGFGLWDSDLDVMLVPWGIPQNVSPEESWSLLEAAHSTLQEHWAFGELAYAEGAHIQTLRCRFRGVLPVDVSVCYEPDMHGAGMLRSFAEVPVCATLCICVKLWAKAHELVGRRHVQLSSYGFVVMGLYFLHLRGLLADTSFQGNLGELLSDFFDFYANEFRWDQEVVTLRSSCGERIFKCASDAPGLGHCAQESSVPMRIEDPALHSHNLAKGLDPDELTKLQQAIMATSKSMRAGCIPRAMLTSEFMMPG